MKSTLPARHRFGGKVFRCESGDGHDFDEDDEEDKKMKDIEVNK